MMVLQQKVQLLVLLGDSGVGTPLNKIIIDSSNNHLEFNVNVGGVQ